MFTQCPPPLLPVGSSALRRMRGCQASMATSLCAVRTADVDFSFWDLFNSEQFRRGIRLAYRLDGLRGSPTGRLGRLRRSRLEQFDFSGDAVSQHNPIAKLESESPRRCGFDYETTMARAARRRGRKVGRPISATAFDALAVLAIGTRNSISLGRSMHQLILANSDLGGQVRARSHDRARCDPVDPFVGLRVRHRFAPGKELNSLATSMAFA